MEEINVIHRDQDAFAIFVRDYVIQVDQPMPAAAGETGPTPVELFVAALAACVAHYACRHLRKEGLPYIGLEVGARHVLTGIPPQRISRLTLTVRPPSALREDEADGMIAAIEDCTITRSLLEPPDLEVRLADETAAA